MRGIAWNASLWGNHPLDGYQGLILGEPLVERLLKTSVFGEPPRAFAKDFSL
jgi:hypothetical protein